MKIMAIRGPRTGCLLLVISALLAAYMCILSRKSTPAWLLSSPEIRNPMMMTNDATTPLLKPELTMVNQDSLIFLVYGSPGNVERRQLIREFWGEQTQYGRPGRIVVVFVFGILRLENADRGESVDQLRLEAHRNQDILLLDVADSDYTNKELAALKWIADETHFGYIVRIEDYVIPVTYAWIDLVAGLKRNNYTCYLACEPLRQNRDNPKTDINHHMIMVQEEDVGVYPITCDGRGYMMTRDTLESILEVAQYLPLAKQTDAYITGILTALTKVAYLNIKETVVENMLSAQIVDESVVLFVRDVTSGSSRPHAQWKSFWGAVTAKFNRRKRKLKQTFILAPASIESVPEKWQLPPGAELQQTCANRQHLILTMDI